MAINGRKKRRIAIIKGEYCAGKPALFSSSIQANATSHSLLKDQLNEKIALPRTRRPFCSYFSCLRQKRRG
jgi:hypothetical protein